MEDPHYFDTELIIDKWVKEGRLFEVPFYRRSIQEIINTTLHYFNIVEIIEPKPTENFKNRLPDRYESLLKCPQFLIIKAVKL